MASPKYLEKRSALRVALIKINFRSGLLGEKKKCIVHASSVSILHLFGRRSLMMMVRKSDVIFLSWTSSMMT